MSPRRTTKPERLSPTLVRLIDAVEHHSADAGTGRDITGAAGALREFGELALWALPIHGFFVAGHERIAVTIERVAARHLGLEDARREFRKAIANVEAFDRRDAIESAHNHIRSVADDAYFYAGLAFDITATSVW
jgi:hypothetical protein